MVMAVFLVKKIRGMGNTYTGGAAGSRVRVFSIVDISPYLSTGYKERYGSFSNIGRLVALIADELSLVYLFPQQSTYSHNHL